MWAFGFVVVAIILVYREWRRSKLDLYIFAILRTADLYCHFWHRWSCRQRADLPDTGPCLVISNHTCSADPPFLQSACDRPLSFLVADEHYDTHPVPRWVLSQLHCVRVTRDGRDWRALRRALQLLANGRAVCVFPEGNLSGVLTKRMLPPRPGVALLALRTRVPVYPAYISGGPRTDKLLRSWLWPASPAVRVRFGPAIDLSKFYDRPITRPLLDEVGRYLMDNIRALSNGRDAEAQREPHTNQRMQP